MRDRIAGFDFDERTVLRLSHRRREGRAKSDLEPGLPVLVGLADEGDTPLAHLTPGQLQLATLAVVLSIEPPLLFADEPTGNLDSASGAGAFTRDGNPVRIR